MQKVEETTLVEKSLAEMYRTGRHFVAEYGERSETLRAMVIASE
jgi:hypothetical protein